MKRVPEIVRLAGIMLLGFVLHFLAAAEVAP